MRQVIAASLVGGLLLAVSVVAAQDYPHAFPRTGVTRLFDGERFTVWEVHWIHGVKQPIHRHRYDMAGVYLRFGEITVTTPDGSATTGKPFAVPRPYFQLAGITHKEEAMGKPGDPERLAIMVDLKGAPQAPFTASGMTAAFPRPGATNVLENDRVRMWDYTWHKGQPTAIHTHAMDTIQVFMTGGTIRTTDANGKAQAIDVAFKTARVIPRGSTDKEEATAGEPRAIVIEVK